MVDRGWKEDLDYGYLVHQSALVARGLVLLGFCIAKG